MQNEITRAEPCTICDDAALDDLLVTAHSRVFFAHNRRMPAHLVVAVRSHRRWLTELSDEEAADVLVTARRVAVACAEALAIEKCYLAAVGDVDRHFHLHVLPKVNGATGLGPFIFGAQGWIEQVSPSLTHADEMNVAKLLRALKNDFSES